MRFIWLKFYLRTHSYILSTYAKNQDLKLRIKLCLRPIKTPLRDFFLHFSHGTSDGSQTALGITFICNPLPVKRL